jgi:hypothetical protein
VIPLGEGHLRRTIAEFVVHYHRERNHQGLSNELIQPLARSDDQGPARQVVQAARDGRRALRKVNAPDSRPLRVSRQRRMLDCVRFPEHCRTPPGNPPRPRATASPKPLR